jgi:hypothetical protein
MFAAILVAALLVVAIFAALLAIHISMANRLKEEYHKALISLTEHPDDGEIKNTCRACGRSYYRFIRIKDHASFMDFPMPYVDSPEVDDEMVERDIADRLAKHPPAA